MLNSIVINKVDAKTIILTFMVAVYPLIVVQGPLDIFRGPRYIILAVISLIAFSILFFEKISLDKTRYIPLGIFLIFALISTLLAENITVAWIGNGIRFTGFSTYLFCVSLFLVACNYEKPMRIIKPMIACAVIVSIIGLMQYLGIIYDSQDYYKSGYIRVLSTIGNANWFGTYVVFILPSALILYLKEKKLSWLMATSLIYAGLLVSLTRGAWLAFFVIFILISFVFYQNHKLKREYFILIISLMLVTVVIMPANDWGLINRVYTVPNTIGSMTTLEGPELQEEFFRQPRTVYWRESVDLIKDNWAFGVGPDNINITLASGALRDKLHNAYLEIAASMGLFALVSYLVFLSTFIRRQRNMTGYILLVMVVTYIVQGVTIHDVVSVMPLFWIVLGLFQANNERINLKDKQDTNLPFAKKMVDEGINNYQTKKILLFIISGCLIIFLVIVLCWYYYPTQDTVELPSGGLYTGQLRGNTFHGYGVLELPGGTVYEGYFKHGHFDGYGTLLSPNGSFYAGEFEKGYFHGQGILTTQEGNELEGTWRRGSLLE